MGKKKKLITFDDGTGSKRWKNDLQDVDAVPEFSSGGPRSRNDMIGRESRHVKALENKMKLAYPRCPRKMGTSTFFDPDTGLPIKKTRSHEIPLLLIEVPEYEEPANDVMESSSLEECSNVRLEPKKHIFFDVHTGLQTERSPMCVTEEHSESVVPEQLPEVSQVQEPSEDSIETPPTERTAESAALPKKKKKRKKRKSRCQPLHDDQYTINDLPLEVLEKILCNLPATDRKNGRLVNSHWYSALCQHKEYLSPITLGRNGATLRIHKTSIPVNDFAECGFRRLHLSFKNSDLSYFSGYFWDNVMSRILSLKLMDCCLGSAVVESLITYCENLQYLKIYLSGIGRTDEGFCSAHGLEELDILRPKLKIFKFRITSGGNMSREDGERVFTVLFRIFPDIKTYSFGHSCAAGVFLPAFKCTFTKAVLNEITDRLRLTNMFSHILTSNAFDWAEMMNVLSGVRLSRVSLRVTTLTMSDVERTALVDFFTQQTALNTVQILPYDNCFNMLKPVFYKILESCRQLSKFIYCPSSTDDCTQNLLKHEWEEFIGSKVSKLENFSIGRFVIEKTSLHSIPDPNSPIELRSKFGKGLMSLIESFTRLEHVSLQDNVSDYILQTIFKHLKNLESLDVGLGPNVTKFGLLGHRKFLNEDSQYGYPISNLQSLRKLVLRKSEGFAADSEMFASFGLPTLIDLNCFLPQGDLEKQWRAMICLGRCTCVETVEFSTATDEASLVNLLSYYCVTTKCLKTLTVHVLEDYLTVDSAQKIFSFCPSLQTLHCNGFTYRPTSSSRGVVVKYPSGRVNSHVFFTE